MPGNIVKRKQTIFFPSRIAGTMERIITNWKRLASKVQASLTFGRFPEMRMRTEPRAGQERAKRG